jgi:putative oxidoreductase
MNLNLTTNAAVVTSASRGIGLATVQTLIDEGVRVVGAARITVVLGAATLEWLLGR